MSQKGRAGDGGRGLAKVDQRAARSTEKGHLQDPVRIGPGKSIVIDMSQLPTPTNVYDADVAWIEHRFGDVRLFFGKVSRNKEHALRSRLEIRYPPEAVVGHLWRNSRVFHESLTQHLAKWTAGQKERASLTPQA